MEIFEGVTEREFNAMIIASVKNQIIRTKMKIFI